MDLAALITWIFTKISGVDPLTYAGFGLVGLAINFALKKWMTADNLESVGDLFQKGGFYFGKICTLGLSHWKYTKPLWNNILEPYVILIVLQIDRLVSGIVEGLQSDNPSTKE